jgi:hypothetical protein
MIGRYSLLGGSIYKSKLNDFVFYNPDPVKIHVACTAEQNVTQGIEEWITEPSIILIIN